MTDYSLRLRGEFLQASTPDKGSYLIPHWIEDQALTQQQLAAQGDFGLSGVVRLEETRPYHCRAFLSAREFEQQVRLLEERHGAQFLISRRDLYHLPHDACAVPEIIAAPVYLPPGRMEAFARDALVLGLRPFRDPRYVQVMETLEASLAAAGP